MSDYPRCRTCKHFQPCVYGTDDGPYVWRWEEHDWDAQPDGPAPLYPGWCRAVSGPADPDDPTTHPEAGRLAIAVDGSTYSADLLVTPDFGCILHSDITPPPPDRNPAP